MSINTKTGRPNAALREGIASQLAEVGEVILAVADGYLEPDTLTDERAGQLHSALTEVLAYADECERVGVSMHPADVRSLVAAALGVTA